MANARSLPEAGNDARQDKTKVQDGVTVDRPLSPALRAQFRTDSAPAHRFVAGRTFVLLASAVTVVLIASGGGLSTRIIHNETGAQKLSQRQRWRRIDMPPPAAASNQRPASSALSGYPTRDSALLGLEEAPGAAGTRLPRVRNGIGKNAHPRLNFASPATSLRFRSSGQRLVCFQGGGFVVEVGSYWNHRFGVRVPGSGIQ